jgi:hypothetical protein
MEDLLGCHELWPIPGAFLDPAPRRPPAPRSSYPLENERKDLQSSQERENGDALKRLGLRRWNILRQGVMKLEYTKRDCGDQHSILSSICARTVHHESSESVDQLSLFGAQD